MCCEKEKKDFFESWGAWEDAWAFRDFLRTASTQVETRRSSEVDGSEYQDAIELEEKTFQVFRQKQKEYWECVQQCRERQV